MQRVTYITHVPHCSTQQQQAPSAPPCQSWTRSMHAWAPAVTPMPVHGIIRPHQPWRLTARAVLWERAWPSSNTPYSHRQRHAPSAGAAPSTRFAASKTAGRWVGFASGASGCPSEVTSKHCSQWACGGDGCQQPASAVSVQPCMRLAPALTLGRQPRLQ